MNERDIVERLRNRAFARLALSRPKTLDKEDAAIDHVAADEIERLRAALQNILHCTAHIHEGELVFDCGNPYDLARGALGIDAGSQPLVTDGVWHIV